MIILITWLRCAEDKVSLEVSNPLLQGVFWVVNLLLYKVPTAPCSIISDLGLALEQL